MTELERALTELGARIEFPPTPDLASGVRARLARRPRRGPFFQRRALAVALAVLALAAATALAVPPARSALLRWLGIEGARIERVEELPPTPREPRFALGERVTLAEVRARAGFPVAAPSARGFERPDAVYFSRAVPGGMVSFVYGRASAPRALVTQFLSEPGFPFIQKSATPETTIERIRVDGEPGYWLAGKPHTFVFRNARGVVQHGTLRLAGNTLVWQAGDVTLRLEGGLTKAQALRVAESLTRR